MVITLALCAVLTLLLLAEVVPQLLRERNCLKRGHRWESTDDGWRCRRCKAERLVGDHM